MDWGLYIWDPAVVDTPLPTDVFIYVIPTIRGRRVQIYIVKFLPMVDALPDIQHQFGILINQKPWRILELSTCLITQCIVTTLESGVNDSFSANTECTINVVAMAPPKE